MLYSSVTPALGHAYQKILRVTSSPNRNASYSAGNIVSKEWQRKKPPPFTDPFRKIHGLLPYTTYKTHIQAYRQTDSQTNTHTLKESYPFILNTIGTESVQPNNFRIFFWDRVLQCSLSWPLACYVCNAGQEFTKNCLHWHPKFLA